jgi:serine/threonine protein kinase
MVEQSPSTPSTPPMADLEPGYKLDRYELLAPYARGGMASVWLGRVRGKHGFERIVAIKTILPEYASDPDFRAMLLDEARIASAVEHPNVAQTIDVGEEHGVVYLVLEWIDGDSLYTLHRMLEKQKQLLPAGVVLRVMADACRGLHAAHELRDKAGHLINVVHRDVSPHNILINPAGVAKLIDFGVAKAQGRFVGSTSAGIIKGKVRFMAPEQALGKPVDRRADLWSVGATLQYLLTGTNPYSGSNDVEVLLTISRGDAPKPLPSSVHPAIAEVVARALAPDPTNRYQTAASLARAIDVAAGQANCRASAVEVAEMLQTSGKPLQERRQRAIDLALKAAEGRAHYNELLQPIAPPGSSPSSAHSRARPTVRAKLPSMPDLPATPAVPVDFEGDDDDDLKTLVDFTPAPGTFVPAPSKAPLPDTGRSAIAPPPAPPRTVPPAVLQKRSRAPMIVVMAAIVGAGLGVGWKLWSDAHTEMVVVSPQPTVSAPPAASSVAPVASGAPTAQPSSVSIDDLPVASGQPVGTDTAAAKPPVSTQQRPVVVGPPRPPPPAQPAATGDRQRNFGF